MTEGNGVTMTTLARQLTRGMASQLERVNQSPARLQERIADLERQIARRDETIRSLRAQLAAHDIPLSMSLRNGEGLGEGFNHNNRPAATAAVIARLHNVNISNVYRQLQKNKLQGAVVNGHWIVYTDQTISFKNHRRRSK